MIPAQRVTQADAFGAAQPKASGLMTTGAHTQLLADLFGSHGLETCLVSRLADHAQSAIRIWPYAVSQDRARMNEPLLRPSESGHRESPRDHQRTHVLVLPSTMEFYDQARRIVLENPLLALGQKRARVMIEPLALSDTTALFVAAQVEHRLALALVLDDA